MSIDFSGLPISGSLAVGFVFVAAFSYVVAGPVVADRTIKMDGWEARCASKLTREIKREHQSSLPIDAFDCRAIAGSFDPSGAKICGFLDMLAAPAKAAQARAQSLARERINAALEGVTSTCSCAVALASEQERMSFAIYAGSLRLIKPEPVARLHATLDSAARNPKCAALGEAK